MHSIQEKISSGKKITKASDDPIGAVELSAVREQRDILTQYLSNSSSAATRLDLTDKTLDEILL